ncbi:MAG: PrgI family protein [Lachnospiraceae bacterium]|nr:PrgI family protein [Lachnospiraceae bacterium]
MAIGVDVPKNLSGIKTKVAFNLTRRQLICFGAAALIGVPLYLGVRNTVGTDIAAILMMAVMVPLFILAMYEKDGKPAEKILMLMIRQRYILPGIRRYKSENLYMKLEERENLRKEVERLEVKAREGKGIFRKEDPENRKKNESRE